MSARPLVVLLIEDEPQMRHFLRAALGGDDYQLIEASTAREGLAQAAGRNPDLILLDLGLPDADGLTVTRRIREWTATPIIVISARGQERDKIAALDAGADDYLTKPFSVPELLARMRVAVRHALAMGGPADPVFETAALKVDLTQRRVFKDGHEVHLTPNEYRLLQVLVRHAGKVLTHRQLLKEAWGPGATEQIHNLRVFMNQLRQKLEEDPTLPRLLLTELGVGYRLKTD
jgi:two-component system KDP operon response regulator KdpE